MPKTLGKRYFYRHCITIVLDGPDLKGLSAAFNMARQGYCPANTSCIINPLTTTARESCKILRGELYALENFELPVGFLDRLA